MVPSFLGDAGLRRVTVKFCKRRKRSRYDCAESNHQKHSAVFHRWVMDNKDRIDKLLVSDNDRMLVSDYLWYVGLFVKVSILSSLLWIFIQKI